MTNNDYENISHTRRLKQRPQKHTQTISGKDLHSLKAQTPETLENTQTLHLKIQTRRFRAKPQQKRDEYIERLEKVMRECDTIITNPNGYETIQLKAMNTLTNAIGVCYRLVSDIELEELENEINELKNEEEALKGGRRLAYIIEEPP